MSEQDTSTTEGGGTATDTTTEDNAASQLLASWVSEPGDKADQRGTDGSEQAQDVKSLPEWAQKQITDLRSENARYRTGRNEAEQKYQGTLDAIAQALGLKENEKPDPDKLAQQLSTEQASAREAQVQLAVYRRAGENGANADALLDSASFLRSLSDVDPSQQDAVDAAIKAAVDRNPSLAAEQPETRRPSFNGGPRQSAPVTDMNQLIRRSAGRGG